MQRTLATILGALAVVDLSPFADDFRELLPWKHWHAALRLVGAVAIFWRATQVEHRREPEKEKEDPPERDEPPDGEMSH